MFIIDYIKTLYDSRNIKNVEKQRPTIQMAAVKDMWETIKYIKNPTEEAQLVALGKNINAYNYISEPCEKARMFTIWYLGLTGKNAFDIKKVNSIILKHPWAVTLIPRPDLALQLLAVAANPNLINRIRDPHPEALRYVMKISPETLMGGLD